jgi:hypothetical protein
MQVPAIITEELFLAVQQKIAQNKALSKRNRKHEYLFLAGRLRCGRCGRGMSGYSAHDRRRYRCLSQVWHPSSPQVLCRGQVLEEAVEGPVWQAVERILNDPTVIVQELERRRSATRQTEHEAMREMKVIHSAMSKLDRELRQWEHAYANAVLTLDEFKTYKLDIQKRRAMLLAGKRAFRSRSGGLPTTKRTWNPLRPIAGRCGRSSHHLIFPRSAWHWRPSRFRSHGRPANLSASMEVSPSIILRLLQH